MSVLEKKGAVSAVLYHSERAQPNATDVWPDIRDSSKIPSRYFPISDQFSNGSRLKRRGLNVLDSIRPSKILKLKVRSRWDLRPDVPGWPKERLPTEMFEEIASYLSRDDIKSMRLVSREFDKHVSQVLFRTVVVPFNTEIYGMLGQDRKPDYKGKGKVKIEVNKGLSWKNANGDDVYNGHGLDVFRGFGPHIRKYGMSFDVDEEALAKPPFKGTTENHASFWGNYEWPFEEYRRFDDVAGLELAADETPKMKTAFSMLQKVQELALSLDSGLGWLKGPDRSIRARIIRKQPEVFGPSKEIPDRKEQAQQELWDYLNRVHDEARIDLKTATLYRMAVNIPFKELRPIIDAHAVPEMLSKFPYLDPCLVAEATLDEYTVDDRRDDSDLASVLALAETSVPDPVLTPTPSVGVLYSSSTPPSDVAQLRSSIVPTKLSKAQKEWLMETEWAQRAFLSSYMLAVMDNPTTFETVHTLNVARISSRYASALCRQDFWDALPQLKTVTIQVLPDWRNVVKDEAGYVETPRVDPQHAIEPFYQLLKDMISPRKNIKNLTIGWAAGGEHAEGIHARNKHILPAPVLLSSDALLLHPSQIGGVMLSFPYVQQLTLRNCWVTPPALQELVKKHDKTRLTKLTLQSVSLTAMPRVLANQNAAQNANQNANQNLNGVFNLQNQLQAMANVQQAHNAAQNNGVGNQPNAAGLQLGLPNGAAQQGGPPQQLIALQIQALQLQINHLQNQQGAQAQAQIPNMQAQLQAHLHVQNQLQAHIPPGFPPGFVAPQQQQQAQQVHQLVQQHQQQQQAPPPLPQVSAQSAVRTQPREGSWPYILDIISPGQNLADFGSSHSHADADRESSLRELELVSCGYVRLPHANLDESGLEPAHAFLRHPFFSKRYNALAPAMLSSKDALMGEIVQEVDAVECAAVNVAWFLNTGWEDDSEAVAVEFDGCLRGGEGRFSGVLRASDRVAGAE
ncbi:hypothetical protein BU16DRAFT_466962 [Lophium mytilinum]|uniref:F-box domain-containing protein n=1 Tax=Lophium mytilinum TaxID=390894 RepID=A0A6A6QK54_9PEZI|nr:hypothetical protein BU16DRAFT_466962 [Lophium mytilinum]